MQDGFSHCEAIVRAADKDRFLSALFAPAEHRGALYALYAFNVEVARIRDLVKEPMAGEVRLQWWREALAGERPVEARGHPVAGALVEVIARHGLPLRLFDELIEARRFDLGIEAPESLDQIERYAGHTSSNLIELAARVLDAAMPKIAGPAGVGMGIAGLLRRFAADAASGRLFVPTELLERHGVSPADVLAGQSSDGLVAALANMRGVAARRYEEARGLASGTERKVMAAWLPAALIPLDLRALQRQAQHPFGPVEVPQWRRQWALWRAARKGRPGAL